MKKARFTQDQIIGILKEHQAGASAADLCRKHGISDATFYTWRSKYGGMEVSEARRLRALEVACCRFRGHEDKIVTKELESGYDETEVQP
jgi:transposase-like protein